MPEIYVYELKPRTYGFFRSKKGWQKHFPPLSQKSTYKYTFRADKSLMPKYKAIAKKMKVDCHAYPRSYARSNSYRAPFLKKHPPVRGKYRCWYCGRRVKKITVDHIYPVKAVQTNAKLQKKLKKKGITNVNDEKNLALACDHCNKKKGKKLGDYPWRASLGQHEWYWKIMHGVKLALFVLGIVIILYSVNHNQSGISFDLGVLH